MRQCAQNSKTCSALSSGASVIAARWARTVAQAGARAHTCATHSFAPCGHEWVRTAARMQARTHACTHASLNCHACMHALDVLTCKRTHYAGTHCTRVILASCTPHARSSSNGSSRSHQTCCASDIRHNPSILSVSAPSALDSPTARHAQWLPCRPGRFGSLVDTSGRAHAQPCHSAHRDCGKPCAYETASFGGHGARKARRKASAVCAVGGGTHPYARARSSCRLQWRSGSATARADSGRFRVRGAARVSRKGRA
jgi:hypothetical protein